jgi:hypothetical protein
MIKNILLVYMIIICIALIILNGAVEITIKKTTFIIKSKNLFFKFLNLPQ